MDVVLMEIRLSRFFTLLFFCVTLLLVGCAGTRQIEPISDESRICYEKIDLAGRFSVRYKRDDEEHAMHGRFVWAQRKYDTQLTLLSPLGQVVAKMEVAPGVTVLTLSDEDVRIAADPDALAKDALGWSLPVSGMRGWMQGCAQDEDGEAFVANPANRQVVTQDGWQLDYRDWVSGAYSKARPKRIDMQHQGGEEDVSLRLVIDTWKPR